MFRFLRNSAVVGFILTWNFGATAVYAADDVLIYDSNSKDAAPEVNSKAAVPKSVSKAPVVIGNGKSAKTKSDAEKPKTKEKATETAKEKPAANPAPVVDDIGPDAEEKLTPADAAGTESVDAEDNVYGE